MKNESKHYRGRKGRLQGNKLKWSKPSLPAEMSKHDCNDQMPQRSGVVKWINKSFSSLRLSDTRAPMQCLWDKWSKDSTYSRQLSSCQHSCKWRIGAVWKLQSTAAVWWHFVLKINERGKTHFVKFAWTLKHHQHYILLIFQQQRWNILSNDHYKSIFDYLLLPTIYS